MTQRVDVAVAARGLARSRTHARALIDAGAVLLDGTVVTKASIPVPEGALLEVRGDDGYVSRAAHKLVAALDAFPIRVTGRLALDMGASTGGFTQVLRARGARRVIAVDVGHGQLAASVAADEGVVSVEGFTVRDMDAARLRAASGVSERPQLVCGDLSFISLTLVLPAVRAIVDDDADIVLLIKPQFEVGRAGVRHGIVVDAARRRDAIVGVMDAASRAGLRTHGLVASPVVGTHGNHEYLIWLRPGAGSDPTEWTDTVNDLTGER